MEEEGKEKRNRASVLRVLQGIDDVRDGNGSGRIGSDRVTKPQPITIIECVRREESNSSFNKSFF